MLAGPGATLHVPGEAVEGDTSSYSIPPKLRLRPLTPGLQSEQIPYMQLWGPRTKKEGLEEWLRWGGTQGLSG